MKRILVCLTALLILAALVGCGENNQPPCGGEDFLPTATPTSVPTATPTPAPLTFQDLLDKSETEEVVVNIYPLITGSNVYGYESHMHRLYVKDGLVRMTIELPGSDTKEAVFDHVTYVESYDTQYHPNILSDIELISSWGDDLRAEWGGYKDLLDNIDGAYALTFNNPYDVGNNILISKVVLWQKDATFYLLLIDPNDKAISTMSGLYEDNTFANTEADWNLTDLIENSYVNPILFEDYEYIKNAVISSTHSMKLEIKDGTLLLNGKKTFFTYQESFDFEFLPSLYFGAHIESTTTGKGIASSQYKQRLLEHLQTLPGCYVENAENDFWVIYQVGNTLYFLEVSADADGGNTCCFIYAKTFAE